MKLPMHNLPSLRAKLQRELIRQRDGEDGSLIAFSLVLFLVMILFGSVAVDLMLYENERTHIQNSTDRAVLAAANLDQTVDSAVVVQDYLAKVGVDVDEDDISVTEIGSGSTLTGRRVAVRIDDLYQTMLMGLMGVHSLPYAGASQAEEAIQDIEVSLVLDVSGSMGSNDKLENMQVAATSFVAQVLKKPLDENGVEIEDNRVSISLVPYATQVSIGPDLMAVADVNQFHNYSYCTNFQDYANAYDTTAITSTMSQTAHFDPWYSGSRRHYDWSGDLTPNNISPYRVVCRNTRTVDVLPWSNNEEDLTDRIDELTAQGNTSIDLAVKWGAALLDPSMQDELDDLVTAGVVNSVFAPRPHDFTYPDTKKFIVVMTDGINTTQYYLKDEFKYGNSSIYLLEDENSTDDDEVLNYYMKFGSYWWNASDRVWEAPLEAALIDSNDPDAPLPLSWANVWNNMRVKWWPYNFHYARYWNANDYYDNLYGEDDGPRFSIGASEKDDNLDDICTAAKDQGIIVFSIGFEVTDYSAGVMEDCATSPSHFYRVEGLDIEDAFAQIASEINKLKLTR